MTIPTNPKIYHIVHIDRLSSIIGDGWLWCDAVIMRRPQPGEVIGMNHIKQRRLTSRLSSHSALSVGDCVPFYFCPRSIMLYVISQKNHPDLIYTGGQGPIIHLEADLRETVEWSNRHNQRWAFTLSNAGSLYFEDSCDLVQLNKIDWNAVNARSWPNCKESKQAEFLIERQFPWELISRIGVYSKAIYQQVIVALNGKTHKPVVEIKPDWYY